MPDWNAMARAQVRFLSSWEELSEEGDQAVWCSSSQKLPTHSCTSQHASANQHASAWTAEHSNASATSYPSAKANSDSAMHSAPAVNHCCDHCPYWKRDSWLCTWSPALRGTAKRRWCWLRAQPSALRSAAALRKAGCGCKACGSARINKGRKDQCGD